jgi:hypothetical protein
VSRTDSAADPRAQGGSRHAAGARGVATQRVSQVADSVLARPGIPARRQAFEKCASRHRATPQRPTRPTGIPTRRRHNGAARAALPDRLRPVQTCQACNSRPRCLCAPPRLVGCHQGGRALVLARGGTPARGPRQGLRPRCAEQTEEKRQQEPSSQQVRTSQPCPRARQLIHVLQIPVPLAQVLPRPAASSSASPRVQPRLASFPAWSLLSPAS